MVTISTSPPLGIAMLKGYVERQLPDWDIKLLDLNLWFLNKVFAGIAAGTGRLSEHICKEIGATNEELLQASKVMRGLDNDFLYSRPDIYSRSGDVFSKFCQVTTKMFTAECAEYERTQKFPPLLADGIKEILALKPDCVGISMIFSEQLPMGAAIGRFLRQRTLLKVFMGGSCLIEGAEHFLKWYPESADVIIVGDGEEPLRQLLVNDINPKGIPGAVYWESGKIVKEAPVFLKNVDQFGIPCFDGLDLYAYYSPEPVIPLLLSRGCYWRKCTFCVHYFSAGDTYRVRSLDSIIEVLKYFVSKGLRNFSFVDEMIAPGQFARLAEGIKDAKLDIVYYAYSKPNKTFSPTVLKEIAESGCKFLLWGVESGNQRVLDLMGKGTKVEEVSEVMKNAHAAGVENHLFIIGGFPTETHEEFADTLRFLMDNKDYIYAINSGPFGLDAGAPINKSPEKFGIVKTWVHTETPLGAQLAYTCSSGVSMEEAWQNWVNAVPLFRAFHPHANLVAYYRDHALLIYKHMGSKLRPELRNFPDIMEVLPAPLMQKASASHAVSHAV
ncbi:MAG: B12-binding domain-containing radical SAM protein [Gammaproteobacteria bacterium]|nr:B12-binding domain-containing radical SAM protein [Gammaproteobacteria bacterium]